MKFIIIREDIIKPLKQVTCSLSNRPQLPILSNVLLQVKNKLLFLTGTDLEIEIITIITLNNIYEEGNITISAKKFFDICRSLPKKSNIFVKTIKDKMLISSGLSYYSLSTLPAHNFPTIDIWQVNIEFTISKIDLKILIESTQFAMAYQDVRYYLNGMLLEIRGNKLRTVATDGYRMAVCTMSVFYDSFPFDSVIIPRKGIIELLRILEGDDSIRIQIGNNNIRVKIGNYSLTSKLIVGRFPDYCKVFPKHTNNILEVKCDKIKTAFSRVSILAHEKFNSVCLNLSYNKLKITTSNSEKEKAEEILDVYYKGENLNVNFNVKYILDVLNTIKGDIVKFLIHDEISGMQIEDVSNKSFIYIVMPVRF